MCLNECSRLFPLISSPDADSFDRGFSVSLTLLKVGVLGCMAMDVSAPCWTALGKSSQGVLAQVLLG
jgi:hypothetical protein